METHGHIIRYRAIASNLSVILFFLIISHVSLAQRTGGNLQIYQETNAEVGILTAATWLLSPSAFRASWPRYGYTYDEFRSSCDSESLQRYDIGSGVLASPGNGTYSESGRYIGLPLADNTRHDDIVSFIETVAGGADISATSRTLNAGGVQEGDGERGIVRMREICSLLPDQIPADNPTNNLVVITQHPVPGSSATLRLSEVDAASR